MNSGEPSGLNGDSPTPEDGLVPVVSNYTPQKMHKFLEFIDFNSRGDLALGSSSLNTKLWTGQLWYFKAEKVQSGADVAIPNCIAGLELETTVVEGKFLSDDMLLLGLDSGSLQLVQLTKDIDDDRLTHYLECQAPVTEHRDSLTSLCVWGKQASGPNLAASVGSDLRLNIYSHNLALNHSYSPCDSRQVGHVAASRTENSILATAASGGVRLWDTRLERPAVHLLHSSVCPAASVVFDGSGGSDLCVSTMEGQVLRLDKRVPGQAMGPGVKVGDRPLTSMAWEEGGHRLGVGGQDTQVTVLAWREGGEEEVEYQDTSSHRDFVKGLAWKEGMLWSASWDGTVVKHTI